MTAQTRLVDIVFPGDANHHGTLFGGVGLAHMDKVAFICATRHGRVDFVTASCERIDFDAPARVGEIVDVTGRVVRIGRRSLAVGVEMVAEALLTGERRRCSSGTFNMVAVDPATTLAPLAREDADTESRPLRVVELILPEQTSHYGSLYGGQAISAMSKTAFVVATRSCRKTVVLVSAQRVDFTSQIATGEIIEIEARMSRTGRTSLTIDVTLSAERLHSGERRRCGSGRFVFVAVDAAGHPVPAS
jgi:acyl-CoA hydrolase